MIITVIVFRVFVSAIKNSKQLLFFFKNATGLAECAYKELAKVPVFKKWRDDLPAELKPAV